MKNALPRTATSLGDMAQPPMASLANHAPAMDMPPLVSTTDPLILFQTAMTWEEAESVRIVKIIQVSIVSQS